jgi:hypothetical protein
MLALEHLQTTAARWRAGAIDDASYAALYFLHWQAHSHGKRFASRRDRRDARPDPLAWFEAVSALDAAATRDYLLGYVRRYQFLGVIANVPVALAAWLQGEWPLTLCEYIPSPAEVLAMQVAGTRPVTLLAGWPRMLAPVLGKPNAFAFMVHDLEHAFKFFHDPAMHQQQRAFFRVLAEAQAAGHFADYLRDPVFLAKFDYLRSDMNTHTLHAAQFLRAILVEFHLRREGVGSPESLSAAAREAVSKRVASLLGEDWLAEVEKRMIPALAGEAVID